MNKQWVLEDSRRMVVVFPVWQVLPSSFHILLEDIQVNRAAVDLKISLCGKPCLKKQTMGDKTQEEKRRELKVNLVLFFIVLHHFFLLLLFYFLYFPSRLWFEVCWQLTTAPKTSVGNMTSLTLISSGACVLYCRMTWLHPNVRGHTQMCLATFRCEVAGPDLHTPLVSGLAELWWSLYFSACLGETVQRHPHSDRSELYLRV